MDPEWKSEEGIMEPKRRPQGKTDALPERDKLDRRYGEIGISAVKAAVQPHGEQHQQQPRSGARIATVAKAKK
jgi:hypothetical protein